MVIDCHGRIIAETWKADDDMVVADLDASLHEESLGEQFIRARWPELYKDLAVPTGREEDVHKIRFEM